MGRYSRLILDHPLFNLDEDILGLCKEAFAFPEESEEFDPEILQELRNPEILQELRNATLEDVDKEVQNELQCIIDTHTAACETPQPEMKIENIQFKVREQCQLIRDFSYNFVDPDVAKSFLDELTELYTQYYTKLARPEGVLELSKEEHKFKTICSCTQKKTTKQKPKLFQGKLVIPLYKPHGQKRFKRGSAKPLDLEKEIGELPLSQSSQYEESGESNVQSSRAKHKYSKSSPTSTTVPAKKKHTHLLDIMEQITTNESQAQCSSEYTSPFADIEAYRSSTCIKVPAKLKEGQKTNMCM